MIDIDALKLDKRPQSSTIVHALLDRLEAAEKEQVLTRKLADRLALALNTSNHERDALRAKIEQMEKQEPVAWTTKLALEYGASRLGFQVSGVNMWGENGVPLYALPGAQPALSEQDESVRKAWARFSNELHRSPDAPYPGMSAAFEQHFSQSFTDRDWRAESGTWAAAWKAAKNHGAQAHPAPSVPDGWKLVPIGPTQEMINHVIDERLDAIAAGKDHTFIDIYKTMLAAAPKPEAKP